MGFLCGFLGGVGFGWLVGFFFLVCLFCLFFCGGFLGFLNVFMVHWILFTNTLIETYPRLRGLSCILIQEGGEWKGDNLQMEVGRTSQGGWGKITGRVTKHCKQVGLGSCEISVQVLMTEMDKARRNLVWIQCWCCFEKVTCLVPVNLNKCMIL